MATAAFGVLRYSRFFGSVGVTRVLDYGAGTLRNAVYLAERGMTVYAADLPQQVKALRTHPGVRRLAGVLSVAELEQSRLEVDLVLCTYVFNIIVRKSERERYLDNAAANLRPGGFLLMEVNSRPEDILCSSTLHHYLSCDDKARSYTHQEIDRILQPHNFERLCHYYSSHALAAVYRLTRSGN